MNPIRRLIPPVLILISLILIATAGYVFNMTAQLAPVIWGMVVLMVVASVSLLAAHNHN